MINSMWMGFIGGVLLGAGVGLVAGCIWIGIAVERLRRESLERRGCVSNDIAVD